MFSLGFVQISKLCIKINAKVYSKPYFLVLIFGRRSCQEAETLQIYQ